MVDKILYLWLKIKIKSFELKLFYLSKLPISQWEQGRSTLGGQDLFGIFHLNFGEGVLKGQRGNGKGGLPSFGLSSVGGGGASMSGTLSHLSESI